jgi:hypothetical protein
MGKQGQNMRSSNLEGDKIFFNLIDAETRFFSLKLCYEGDKLVHHELEF